VTLFDQIITSFVLRSLHWLQLWILNFADCLMHSVLHIQLIFLVLEVTKVLHDVIIRNFKI